MTSEDELDPAALHARDELHDFLQRNADHLGPRNDGDTIAPDVAFVNAWVLVASWTDEHGGDWLTRIPSKGLATHQRSGLLFEGLYGFDDD